MHGEEERSLKTRIFMLTVNILILMFIVWISFFNGYSIIGKIVGLDIVVGNSIRAILLFIIACIFVFRMSLTGFYMLKRKIGWKEAMGILFAFILYQIGFTFLGLYSSAPLDWLDWLGFSVYIIGGVINTGSEIQRKRFKENPENSGKLYTDGLFRYAQHINYFGDVVWAIGWAMITHNWWAMIIPVFSLLNFIFFMIPPLDEYLEKKYGEDYKEWDKNTKKLIPFIY
jgi:protein-S-isoprenylcysteine O-methyltransferase Ste14